MHERPLSSESGRSYLPDLSPASPRRDWTRLTLPPCYARRCADDAVIGTPDRERTNRPGAETVRNALRPATGVPTKDPLPVMPPTRAAPDSRTVRRNVPDPVTPPTVAEPARSIVELSA